MRGVSGPEGGWFINYERRDSIINETRKTGNRRMKIIFSFLCYL